MGFNIAVCEGPILEVRYSGPVTYAERLEALVTAGPMLGAHAITRVLVDFSAATLQDHDQPARVDFVAKAINLPSLDGCRVALLCLPAGFAEPTLTAGFVRGMSIRRFDARSDAVTWLHGVTR